MPVAGLPGGFSSCQQHRDQIVESTPIDYQQKRTPQKEAAEEDSVVVVCLKFVLEGSARRKQ